MFVSHGEARRQDYLTKFWPHESRSGPESQKLRVCDTRHKGMAKGILSEPGVTSFPYEIREKSER